MAKLHFYYSAMNAGKTTTLLQSNYNYHERGMNTMLFTPKIDDRVGEGIIGSRIGLQCPAIPFADDFDFFGYVQKHVQTSSLKIQCILVDEVHFLKKNHVRQLCQIVDTLNIPVLAYGLRSDFQGEPFEGSKYLLAWADDLIEIKTICHCGRKANMNVRIDGAGNAVRDGAVIEIGDNDRYVATCRRHFHSESPVPKSIDKGRAVA